jgi:hypothetical protein
LHTVTTVRAVSCEKVKVKSTPSVVPVHYMQTINIFLLHLPFIDSVFVQKSGGASGTFARQLHSTRKILIARESQSRNPAVDCRRYLLVLFPTQKVKYKIPPRSGHEGPEGE